MKRKAKRKSHKSKEPVLHVAVVCTESVFVGGMSQRSDGDWGCFVGPEREEVIRRALHARAKWEGKPFGPYIILAGAINARVETPQKFKLAPLTKGDITL